MPENMRWLRMLEFCTSNAWQEQTFHFCISYLRIHMNTQIFIEIYVIELTELPVHM